jgi:hypothetical protein
MRSSKIAKGYNMKFLRGKYRDVLQKHSKPPIDMGWRTNSIQDDCGRYFAALLKKDFTTNVGLEYLAVGGPVNPDDSTLYQTTGDNGFRTRVLDYFDSISAADIPAPANPNQIMPLKIQGKYWVCAVQLRDENIGYVPPNVTLGNPNHLAIVFTFKKADLTGSHNFMEFSLVGAAPPAPSGPSGKFNRLKVYLINYVKHGMYVKDNNVSLERTIDLTFPLPLNP